MINARILGGDCKVIIDRGCFNDERATTMTFIGSRDERIGTNRWRRGIRICIDAVFVGSQRIWREKMGSKIGQ